MLHSAISGIMYTTLFNRLHGRVSQYCTNALALSCSTHAGATLSGFAMLVLYFTGAAMLEGPQPFAERSVLCRPVLWWSLAAVALCVLLGRLVHLLLQAFPEEQPSAAAEPAVPAQPAASTLAAERGATKTAAPARPPAGQTTITPVRADPSDAGQHLPVPAHRGAAAAQPSATCGAASKTSVPRSDTTRRLIIHRRAGAMCSFDLATEVHIATFSSMTHRLTAGVCDPSPRTCECSVPAEVPLIIFTLVMPNICNIHLQPVPPYEQPQCCVS